MIFNNIMQEYSRIKEERINEEIHDANPKKSNPISTLIDKKINSGNHVWIMTDWHFYKWNKDIKAIYKSKSFSEIIKNCQSMIQPDDLLICLGDLCSGECENKADIAAFIDKIPGEKVLVRGNNDLFDDKWYLAHGFKYVTPKFVWDDVLFSHRPEDNDNKVNVHGHMHNARTYYLGEVSKYNNQIDVAYLGARTKPIDINECIRKQPEYAKSVKFINHPWEPKKNK